MMKEPYNIFTRSANRLQTVRSFYPSIDLKHSEERFHSRQALVNFNLNLRVARCDKVNNLLYDLNWLITSSTRSFVFTCQEVVYSHKLYKEHVTDFDFIDSNSTLHFCKKKSTI